MTEYRHQASKKFGLRDQRVCTGLLIEGLTINKGSEDRDSC